MLAVLAPTVGVELKLFFFFLVLLGSEATMIAALALDSWC